MARADLAIDYGTSNTVAVARGADGRARHLLFDGSPLLPSAVYADPADGVRTGRDAVRCARIDPARYEPNPKRRIDESTVLLGDRAYAVTDLIAHTLRRVCTEAVRVTGEPVGRVVVTHPVAWGQTRRGILAAACAEAGLPAPVLVAEPVAAATYFAGLPDVRLADGQAVVVYDLGAGTFDVSVVGRGAAGFETLGYRGLDDVGSLDLDGLVVGHAVAAVARTNPEVWQRLTDPRDTDDRRHHRLLWDDARNAKESLSRQQTASFPLPLSAGDALITRFEFEDLARPMLMRTVEVTAATIDRTGLPADRFAGLFLVGGGSRTPLVATLLHQRQRVVPTTLEQPELVVAEGALAVLTAGNGAADTVRTRPLGSQPVAEAPSPHLAEVGGAPPRHARSESQAVVERQYVPPPAVPPRTRLLGAPADGSEDAVRAVNTTFVGPAVPPPRNRSTPLWPGAQPVTGPPARGRGPSYWILAVWLVLVPIAIGIGYAGAGVAAVFGLLGLAAALIAMLVHGLLIHRRSRSS